MSSSSWVGDEKPLVASDGPLIESIDMDQITDTGVVDVYFGHITTTGAIAKRLCGDYCPSPIYPV